MELRLILILALFVQHIANAQVPASQASQPAQHVVVITGARFSYPLIQKWIEDYAVVNPDVQIVIESRGTAGVQLIRRNTISLRKFMSTTMP